MHTISARNCGCYRIPCKSVPSAGTTDRQRIARCAPYGGGDGRGVQGAWINELRISNFITNFISSQFRCLPLTLRGSELAVGASGGKVARTKRSPSDITTEQVLAIHKHSLPIGGRQTCAGSVSLSPIT